MNLENIFHKRLGEILEDLRVTMNTHACFKDASAVERNGMPAILGQHRSTYCCRVKRSKERMECCRKSDDVDENAHDDHEPYVRTCPFGVTELVVPFWLGGRYQGCLYIGGWRDGKSKNTLPGWERLPLFPKAKALAMGRVAQSALSPILALRETEVLRTTRRSDEKIEEALEVIEERLDARLRAREVARQVHLSESRFLHRFHQAMETGFGAYVRHRVMHRAADLLARTDLKIVDLAFELGYCNQNHFATVFKRTFGKSPTLFRESSQKSEP